MHSVYTCSCSEQFAGTQCQLTSNCNEQYTLTEGQEIRITSPNYPYNYMDNLNCLYNIIASSTDRRVSFTIDDLETECEHMVAPKGHRPPYEQDIVQIGHGNNPADAASIVMRESGTGLIAPFFIDDANAWLKFTSDHWQTGKGFSITVKDVPLAGAVVSQCDAGLCANGDVDECSSSPCQFGGECRDVINGYVCICTAGRQGPNCELVTSTQCQGTVCLNGGTCHTVTDGSYVCSCLQQYTGANCQQTVQTGTRSCQSSPCFNGAQCVDVIDGRFLCICSQSYTGTLCESALALCARTPPPCYNGGVCSDATGNVVCNCPGGYIGTFCEIATQDCICQNGGICFGANNCICSKGFTGQFCEVNINECLSNPCKNGGRCIDGENFFSCVCLTGFSGATCSFRDPNTSQLSANGDGTGSSTGQTLGIGWIILISVLALLLLLLLIFIALRSWKSYDNRYYEDKNHLTDYEENNRFVDSQPREMEMGNILLPQTGATNVTHLNAREEPWPVSTDEMPTSNI
ncbi:uncharacterized protein [Asterias amurensis]|uniref:uncharacterized protein n=1 Tax=Asterias amurensis TaxID=7602 RepID=UPI003AB60E08